MEAEENRIRQTKDSYYLLTNEKLQIERYKRELTRVRDSASFRLGNLIESSLRNPVKFLILPLTIPSLFVRLAREKLGHLERNNSETYPIGSRMGENRDSIVFFPTNGVGFGHFTRLLAVANKIKETDPEMEIIFFTTMPTLHILADFGFQHIIYLGAIGTRIWIRMFGILFVKRC